MGKSTPSAPPSPNPGDVINQQTASNVRTATANSYLNNVNQRTPGGSLTYNRIGTQSIDGQEIPQWEAVTQLSPEQQRIYDTNTRTTQGTADLANQYVSRIADATRQPFSYDGLPNAPQFNQEYVNQTRDQILQRNQPQMERDRAALEQRLANQGIPMGSEAYGAGFDTFNRGVNDFRLGADIQATNTAAQRFGLEDATRKNAITERQALRTQPISEVSMLLGTGQGVQSPQFTPTNNYQIAPTDVAGIYSDSANRDMARWQSQSQQAQQQNSALMSGLFGLGSAGLGGWAYGGFGGRGRG